MQIAPIPTLDDETNQLRLLTAEIVAKEIIPNEHFLMRRGPFGARTERGKTQIDLLFAHGMGVGDPRAHRPGGRRSSSNGALI